MNSMNRNLLVKALLGFVLLSFGASRCPYGGGFGLLLSVVGCAMCLVFALSLGEVKGTRVRFLVRAVLAVIGVLILWAGTIAAATAVAGVFYARSHRTPYTASIEIVMAGICAVIAPVLLTFKGSTWMGYDRRTLAMLWGYWLAFYPFTALAAALGQPWR